MSFGALSATAVTALNRGAAPAGCRHNTGEDIISPYHPSGGELIHQIGSGGATPGGDASAAVSASAAGSER